MSETLLTCIKAQHVTAANTLHTEAPEVLTDLAAACRRAAASSPAPEDIAAVAAMLAPLLLNEDRDNITQAAAVAVRRAAALHRAEVDNSADSLDALTDEAPEDDAPLLRLASPWTPVPDAPYRFTNRDRYYLALASLDSEDRWTAHALLTGTWKGGKAPAAAVRTAHGLPPVTGRAGTAWTAAVTADAERLGITHGEDGPTVDPASPLVPAYRLALDVSTGHTRRRIDAAAVLVDQADKARPEDFDADGQPVPSRPRQQDSRAKSGPATVAVTISRRDLDRLGIFDGSSRRRATDSDLQQQREAAAALVALLPLSQEPYEPTSKKRPKAADVLDGLADAVPDESSDFDPMNTAPKGTGRRLPGVSVDADGIAVAPSGSGAGQAGSSTGTAVQKASPRRKAKGGATGPTVPVGGRTNAAPVQAVSGGKPSTAGMGTTKACRCDEPTPSADTLDALAFLSRSHPSDEPKAPSTTRHCPLHDVTHA